jgi:hypothetical protein
LGLGVNVTPIRRSSAAGRAPAAGEKPASALHTRYMPPIIQPAVEATRLPVEHRRRRSAHMTKLTRSGWTVTAKLPGPPYCRSVWPSVLGTAATQTRRAMLYRTAARVNPNDACPQRGAAAIAERLSLTALQGSDGWKAATEVRESVHRLSKGPAKLLGRCPTCPPPTSAWRIPSALKPLAQGPLAAR